ncbi:hypothetical protein BV25DRAFT_1918844 [Artomyces pyxidatus]|uniref:Uncharacterized protein n=1 Tax=Artomyces pyxidatus TaxID=48021 RepID=A0ACB8SR59_9AGAM|nr:hypothetical protein BV25DRAFT_1918844 [Artomyces pyxidatus]
MSKVNISLSSASHWQPCDQNGNFVPPDAPALPMDEKEDTDWTPIADRSSFHFAELVFEKMEASADDLQEPLTILEAKDVVDGVVRDPLFAPKDAMYSTVDERGPCLGHLRRGYKPPLAATMRV